MRRPSNVYTKATAPTECSLNTTLYCIFCRSTLGVYKWTERIGNGNSSNSSSSISNNHSSVSPKTRACVQQCSVQQLSASKSIVSRPRPSLYLAVALPPDHSHGEPTLDPPHPANAVTQEIPSVFDGAERCPCHHNQGWRLDLDGLGTAFLFCGGVLVLGDIWGRKWVTEDEGEK